MRTSVTACLSILVLLGVGLPIQPACAQGYAEVLCGQSDGMLYGRWVNPDDTYHETLYDANESTWIEKGLFSETSVFGAGYHYFRGSATGWCLGGTMHEWAAGLPTSTPPEESEEHPDQDSHWEHAYNELFVLASYCGLNVNAC